MNNYLFGYWRTIFNGIEWATGKALTAFNVEPVQPREQNVNVVRIDLTTPGLEFFTTPRSGPFHTENYTISDFLRQHSVDPGVKLAINGALAAAVSGDVGAAASLFGLNKCQGNVVSDPTIKAPRPADAKGCKGDDPDVPDATYTGTAALTITRENHACFEIINAASPVWADCDPKKKMVEYRPWQSVWTAVAGSPQPVNQECGWPPVKFVQGLSQGAMVLKEGVNYGIASAGGAQGELVAGRTAVGLCSQRRYLFLLTIDGVEGAKPDQYGAIFHDVGEWLKIAGAWDGITLDGGGSTAMAMIDPTGQPVLMNVPHNSEKIDQPYDQRANAQFFGVVPG